LFEALRTGTRPPLRRVVVGLDYAGTARDLVIALKFGGHPRAALPLAEALHAAVEAAGTPGDVIVPVPLSRRRERERGYNQALVLARALSRGCGVALDARALRRRRHTRRQSGLTRAARRRGPRGAFVARAERVGGRCVLLVDDVLTSGATLRACAVALRRAGAASVTAAVACRSP
jgi:ComF family protein